MGKKRHKPRKARPTPALPKLRKAPRLKLKRVQSKPHPRRRTRFRRSLELDYSALAKFKNWPSMILAYVDWLEDRQCTHTLEEQLRGVPCDSVDVIVKRVGRAHFRSTQTARALEQVHEMCDLGKGGRKPGAPDAIFSCNRCIFSYPGPTEPDVSIVDAFAQSTTARARAAADQLRDRMAILAGRYVR